MPSSKLLAETLRLWAERDKQVSLQAIASVTGLSVRWLYHFDRQASKAPAVDKVECLYNFLSGKQIEL
jgi:hypothetical protein